jgi:hypothetical protein
MNGKGGLGGTDRLEPGKRLGGDRHLYHVQHRLVIARQPLACQVQGCSPNSLGGLPECAHRAHDGRPGRPDLAQLDRAARVRQPVRDHLRPVNGSHPLGDLPGIQQPGGRPCRSLRRARRSISAICRASIVEVIRALAAAVGMSWVQLLALAADKRTRRGGFEGGSSSKPWSWRTNRRRAPPNRTVGWCIAEPTQGSVSATPPFAPPANARIPRPPLRHM